MPFAITDLFGGGEHGLAIDASNFATLFTDSGKTTPATRGGLVYVAADQSGNGNDLTQATSGNRPIAHGLPKTLGANLITDGSNEGIAASGWSGGTGWSGFTKTAGSASSLSFSFSPTAGKMYAVFVDITRTAGTLTPRFTGTTTVAGWAANSVKSITELLIAATGNNTFELYADASFAGEVKGVWVCEVTDFALNGLVGDGSNDLMSSGNIDFSGTNKRTTVVAFWADDWPQERSVYEHGRFALSDAGAVQRRMNVTPTLRARDASSTAGIHSANDTQPQAVSKLIVELHEEDFSQATVGAQFNRDKADVAVAETTNGSALTISALPNRPVSLFASSNGVWPMRGLISRFMMIDRLLTTQEKLDAQRWARGAAIKGCILGDSTVAYCGPAFGTVMNMWPVAAFLPEVDFGEFMLAYPGDKIADQKTKWNALADVSQLDVVIVAVGLNDFNTYAGTKTAAQINADYQDLIDTIRGDLDAAGNTACRIIGCKPPPARGWLGVAGGQQAAAYALWQANSEAIGGGGATPIADLDAYVDSHVAALGNGSDYLASTYDPGADGVHENNYARFVFASAIREALAAAETVETGLATETDQAFGLGMAAGTGTAAETNAGIAPGIAAKPGVAQEACTAVSSAVAIGTGLASETGSAAALAMAVGTGQAAETDQAAGPGCAIASGLGAESDTALAVTAAALFQPGMAGETDLAFGLDFFAAVSPGISSEADQATSVPIAIAASLSSELDAALAPGIAVVAGTAEETNTAVPCAIATTAATAAETDEAQAIALTIGTGLAIETSVATAADIGAQPGIASTADEAFAPGIRAELQTGTAAETSAALPIGTGVAPGLASETDLAIEGGIAMAPGLASETATASALTPLAIATVGLAAENDNAIGIVTIATVAPGLASETDQAMAVGMASQASLSAETDLALAVTPFIVPIDPVQRRILHAPRKNRALS